MKELHELKEKYAYVAKGVKVLAQHIDLLKEVLVDVEKAIAYGKNQVEEELNARLEDFEFDTNITARS